MNGFHALLVAEFIPGDPVFNYWGRAHNKTAAEVLGEAVIIHFIARHKPWEGSLAELRAQQAAAPPQLFAVYEKWYAAEAAMCKV